MKQNKKHDDDAPDLTGWEVEGIEITDLEQRPKRTRRFWRDVAAGIECAALHYPGDCPRCGAE